MCDKAFCASVYAYIYMGVCVMQVNGKLQTSNPDIYAIGDVAAFPLNNYGLNKMFRQEHVANCRQSAKHAGVIDLPAWPPCK